MPRENMFRHPHNEQIHRMEVQSQKGLIYAAQLEHLAILMATLDILGITFLLEPKQMK